MLSSFAMKRKKTYSFLLLELLVALLLFSACVLPLTSIPMRALQSELKTYQRLQLQRISDEAFAIVQAKLYQKEITWEQLNVSEKNKSIALKNEVVPLNIQGIGNKKIERSAYIYSTSKKKGKHSDQYRLVKVDVVLKSPQDKYFFLFKKRRLDTLTITYQVFVHQRSGHEREKPPQAPPAPSHTAPLTA